MYGKPHLAVNAHVVVASRTIRSMDAVAADENLSQHQRLLARQCRDLAASLFRSFEESRDDAPTIPGNGSFVKGT